MSTTALPKSIGVLGSGIVGRVLAAGFVAKGMPTRLGTRRTDDPELQAWAAETGVTLGSFEAAAHADVIVLAVRGASIAVGGVIDGAGGPEAFAGKVVIDVTNPLVHGDDLPPTLEVGHLDSGGERLQRRLPDARVVKAFNTVGNTLMVDPELPGGRPTMFIAGDDEDAKSTVGTILDAFGWEALDVGTLERSRELESLSVLWFAIGVKHGSWDHAITLVRP